MKSAAKYAPFLAALVVSSCNTVKNGEHVHEHKHEHSKIGSSRPGKSKVGRYEHSHSFSHRHQNEDRAVESETGLMGQE